MSEMYQISSLRPRTDNTTDLVASYFIGSVTSNFGTWLQNTAQVVLACQLTHSVFAVGRRSATAVTLDGSDWAQIADLFEQPRTGRQRQDDAPGRYAQARALVFLAWNLTLRKVSGLTRLG